MTRDGLFLLLIALSPTTQAQDKVLFTLDPGWSLFNSENSLKTIGDKSLGWTPGFAIAYESDSLFGFPVRLDYGFTRSIATGALQFIATNSTGMVLSVHDADISFSMQRLDVARIFRPSELIVIAFGPSISLAYRTIELTLPAHDIIPERHFEDRLVSLCLGVNVSAHLEIPFEDAPRFLFFLSGLKITYLHSVWFDKRGRNLDNYGQDSLLGQLTIGLGYSF